MPKFTPNPQAEASSAFDVVQPGTYRMRVKDIKEFTSSAGNECLKVQLEFVDPSSALRLDGQTATNPGNIFDNGLVTSPKEKQGRLRNFVEACGQKWGDVDDTDILVGAELDVKIKVEEFKGEQANKVNRYLSVK